MLTIKRQLDRIILTIITIVVLVMMTTFLLIEVVSFQQIVISNIVPQAATIGINLSRSLALADRYSAHEILATLAANPTIEGAYLFDGNNQPWTYYQPAQHLPERSPRHNPETLLDRQAIQEILASGEQHIAFRQSHLMIFMPIVTEGSKLGSLYIVCNLLSFTWRLLLWIIAAIGVTATAFAIGMVFSTRMQKRLTDPLTLLTEQMTRIAPHMSDPMRTPHQGHSEIEMLLDGFAQMRTRITQHEQQLDRINASLEQRIAERTDELRRSLHDKEMLLREVHHRVKNNLQVITSLLSLQLKKVTEISACEALRTCLGRTRSIALIHERLYASGQQSSTADLARQLSELAREICQLHQVDDRQIRLQLDLAPCPVDLDAMVNLALILNELLTNTFKHAFPSGATGTVTIRLGMETERLILRVIDDGIGLPADFCPERSQSLGLRLAVNLARQAGGDFEIIRRAQGTEAIVSCALSHQPLLAPPQEI